MLLRCILLFALFLDWGQALSVNRTIDNRYGDSVTGQLPLYMPGPWSEGDQCPGCHAQPDPKQCYNGTWSDTTHHDGLDDGQNVTVQFTGTAVYAYHVLAPPIIYTDTLTNLSFTLDGTPVLGPNFVWDPPASQQEYQYNVPVYVNESLENTDHTLVIHLVGPVSLGLFDYVVYTFDDGISPVSDIVLIQHRAVCNSIVERHALPVSVIDHNYVDKPIPHSYHDSAELSIAPFAPNWSRRRRLSRRSCSDPDHHRNRGHTSTGAPTLKGCARAEADDAREQR